MKTQALSVISLLVALAALVVAASSRQSMTRPEPEVMPRAATTESGRPQAAEMAALAARIEALEKDVRGEGQLKLLSDVSAGLQSMAKRTDKNDADVQGVAKKVSALTSATQEAMNLVGSEIGRLNGKVAQLQEAMAMQQSK